jgi:hypothetical protein
VGGGGEVKGEHFLVPIQEIGIKGPRIFLRGKYYYSKSD